MLLPNKERIEWIKPIMFSAGIGTIEDEHIKKTSPEKGMSIVLLITSISYKSQLKMMIT